jgi:hypothetical protein
MSVRTIKILNITAFFVAIIFSHCGTKKELNWKESKGYRWAELSVSVENKVGFEKLTDSKTGIDFINGLEDEQIISNRHLFDGSGVALGDVDNDGFCDIYFCRLNGPNVLYRNKGNWHFENITEEAGVDYPNHFSKGALLSDIDGDGDLDLIITVLDGPNACFLNDGSGKFTEATKESGLASLKHRTGNTSIAIGDIDGDNDLDLYMVCYKARARKDTDDVRYNTKGQILNRRDFGEPDILYLNDGKGHFKNAKLKSDHFRREDGKLLPMPRAWGLTAKMKDMDNDGDLDIYVCNDFFSPDFIWINDGNGKFKAISKLAIRTTSLSSMTVDFSDVDRDGDLDIFVADMLSRDHQKRKMQMGVMQNVDGGRGKINARPQIMRNTFFLNRGDGTYAEIANYAGLHASDWTWSAIFLDVDLDGYEDLLTTTGHAYDVQDSDTDQKILERKVRDLDDIRRSIFEYPRLDTPNFLFRNKGDLTFEEKGKEWGFDTEEISHGMALADLDNDGDLDVVTNNYETPAGVYKNVSTGPRIAVRLKGLSPNTQGIGAKVILTGGPVVQSKEVSGGGHYLSSSEPLTVFAATRNNDPMRLKIIWPNGKESTIDSVKSNRIYEIDESYSKSITPTLITEVTPFFEDISNLISHFHHERPFDDFYFQPLLPNRMSQLGPGVSWYDIDKDGDDDLIIPSGRDGNLAIFRNDSKGNISQFHNLNLEIKAEQDQTTALAFNMRSDYTSLFVGTTNYENTPQLPSAIRYSIKKDKLVEQEKLPSLPSATGPLALSDYDNDGDLDLFVGGRLLPGKYPAPASSRLYKNKGGKFESDDTNSDYLKNIGLVSGAVFCDIDSDGDSDLILAIEWGPLRIFRNENGKFTDATIKYGLDSYRGWWNGVTTGDFDEDGLLDILATNWGLNSKYHYDPDHSLKIFYADFDNNGIVDIVEAHFDHYMNKIVPERGFSCMSNAMSFVRNNIDSYESYGGSNIHEIVGSGLQTADSVSASTLSHMVFLQRGNRFEAFKLPVGSQFAPAFYAGVADFDGDGHDDVFLAQNFFSAQPETPRIDAGRGLWLRGDGTGQFTSVPGEITGVKVYGEQRGAAISDFNKDGRIDVAVSQNSATTKLYKNVTGKPGLRVRLVGQKNNPTGVGAIVRLIYNEKVGGPAKPVHAGSGYWSQDSPVLVFGTPKTPNGVKVQWPGGKITESKIPPDVREVVINAEGKIVSIAH